MAKIEPKEFFLRDVINQVDYCLAFVVGIGFCWLRTIGKPEQRVCEGLKINLSPNLDERWGLVYEKPEHAIEIAREEKGVRVCKKYEDLDGLAPKRKMKVLLFEQKRKASQAAPPLAEAKISL